MLFDDVEVENEIIDPSLRFGRISLAASIRIVRVAFYKLHLNDPVGLSVQLVRKQPRIGIIQIETEQGVGSDCPELSEAVEVFAASEPLEHLPCAGRRGHWEL